MLLDKSRTGFYRKIFMTGAICYITMCILIIARQLKSSTWFELQGFMLSRTRCVSYKRTLVYTG